MSREQKIIHTIAKGGYLEEIKELINSNNTNDELVVEFIYDLFKGVECEVTLNDLAEYYGVEH